MFHINACFLNKNFEDLQQLLKCTNKKFDVAAVIKTRITRNTFKLYIINLKNYSVEPLPTNHQLEEHYNIANHLSCKSRNDP